MRTPDEIVTLATDILEQGNAAIRQAKLVLADQGKAEYHERLSAAVDKLQDQMDWWARLAAVADIVAIAYERMPDGPL